MTEETTNSQKEVLNLAHRTLTNIFLQRRQTFQEILVREEHAISERRLLKSSIHLDNLLSRAREELWNLTDLQWQRMRDILLAARPPWDEAFRRDILQVLHEAGSNCARALAEMVRQRTSGLGLGASSGDLDGEMVSIGRQQVDRLDVFALGYHGLPQGIGKLLGAPRYQGIRVHWEKATLYLESMPADIGNAGKEAISALEGLAKLLAGTPSGSLGDALKALRKTERVPIGILNTLEKLWGYTNETAGMRHGSAEVAEVGEEEARFVYETCEAAIRFLLSKDRSQ